MAVDQDTARLRLLPWSLVMSDAGQGTGPGVRREEKHHELEMGRLWVDRGPMDYSGIGRVAVTNRVGKAGSGSPDDRCPALSRSAGLRESRRDLKSEFVPDRPTDERVGVDSPRSGRYKSCV